MTTNLTVFSNFELISETRKRVARERQAMLSVLEALREIATRGAHLEAGFGSLHEFCVVELKYSDGAAYRRIEAMRLCDEVPKARDAISSGSLSLSTAAALHGYLKKERNFSAEAKVDLMLEVQGKSRRECERILYPEKTGTPIHFLADEGTMADLARLGDLLAIPRSDVASLIKKIARVALQNIDPTLRKPRKGLSSNAAILKTAIAKDGDRDSNTQSVSELDLDLDLVQDAMPTPLPASPEKLLPATPAETFRRHSTVASRYISGTTKKAVWVRDHSRCTYVDAVSQRRCGGRFGLEIDHRIPIACGGSSQLENLRLLCRPHNQLAARRVYGREKMAAYSTNSREQS